jgi:predicted Rossmann fold flavoprotein
MNQNKDTKNKYDVIVIGGGPAGLMSAGRAAERGLKVLLLEKNPQPGKKLLITGGGRCNVTNAELDTRTLLSHFKGSDQFLFSAFAQYGVQDTLDFFNNRGMATKVEEFKRVFPVSDSARSVFNVLVDYVNEGQVTIQTGAEVKTINTSGNLITGIELTDRTILEASSYILATGGKSRPETGSTGDGFTWLKALGHTIAEPDASLVPIALQDKWISKLAGITLPEVKIMVYQNGTKQASKVGKLLFTHVGVSGPTILNMSKIVGELLDYGEVKIVLDLFPNLDHGALDTFLLSLIEDHQNKQFKNILSPTLPTSLASVIVQLSGISPELQSNSIIRDDRKRLGQLLKALPLTVKHLLGTDKAIVTSGGVALTEVDFKTMCSRRISNLYLVGDLLNIDRPSGGYSLQLCWTTGYVAGNSVSLKSEDIEI